MILRWTYVHCICAVPPTKRFAQTFAATVLLLLPLLLLCWWWWWWWCATVWLFSINYDRARETHDFVGLVFSVVVVAVFGWAKYTNASLILVVPCSCVCSLQPHDCTSLHNLVFWRFAFFFFKKHSYPKVCMFVSMCVSVTFVFMWISMYNISVWDYLLLFFFCLLRPQITHVAFQMNMLFMNMQTS